MWIGSWSEYKIILQLALIAIVDEIHAGIHIRIHDPSVRGNIGAPFLRIVADEIVHLAGQFIQTSCLRMRIGASKMEVQHGLARLGAKSQHGISSSQVERVPISVGEELDTALGLAGIGFKGNMIGSLLQ